MSLRQKILFISKEDNCRYSEGLVQDRFLHAVLIGLRNDNRNKLRPLLKNSILSDENILENLMLAMSDEQERFQNFNKKRVHINSIEPCDPIPSTIPPKHKSENPITAEITSLQATLDCISTWKGNFEKREQSRLPKPDALPHRCLSCHQSSVCRIQILQNHLLFIAVRVKRVSEQCYIKK